MSDFARVMEIARESNPKAVEEALGVPGPGLMEQMEESEKAVAERDKAQAKPAAHPAPAPPVNRPVERK